MTNNPRKAVHYTRDKAKIFQLLNDFNVNNHFVYDPKFKAIRDIVIKNRMSYSEMVELYEKTYYDEK